MTEIFCNVVGRTHISSDLA